MTRGPYRPSLQLKIVRASYPAAELGHTVGLWTRNGSKLTSSIGGLVYALTSPTRDLTGYRMVADGTEYRGDDIAEWAAVHLPRSLVIASAIRTDHHTGLDDSPTDGKAPDDMTTPTAPRPVPPALQRALAYRLATADDGNPMPPLRPDVLEAWADQPTNARHLRAAAVVLEWMRTLAPDRFGDLLADWLAGTPCTSCPPGGHLPDGPCRGTGSIKPPWDFYLGWVAAAGSGEIRLALHRDTPSYPTTGTPVVAVAEQPDPAPAGPTS